jgi:hypothetical protein
MGDRPPPDDQRQAEPPQAEPPQAEPPQAELPQVEPGPDLLSIALVVFFVSLIGIVGALLFLTVVW